MREHDEWLADIATEFDDNQISELIGDEDHAWLCDACAYAHRTGDWLYVKNQWDKHAIPIIKKAAEAEAQKRLDLAEEGRQEYEHDRKMDWAA